MCDDQSQYPKHEDYVDASPDAWGPTILLHERDAHYSLCKQDQQPESSKIEPQRIDSSHQACSRGGLHMDDDQNHDGEANDPVKFHHPEVTDGGPGQAPVDAAGRIRDEDQHTDQAETYQP